MNISFISLGCDKNLVDSEIMLGIIDEAGHKIVTDETEADIVVVNTCSFIADAIEEGIENILEVATLKETGILKGLIVTGCMAQRFKEEIFTEIPEVDAIVGTGDFESIAEVINKVSAGEKGLKFITDKNKKLNTKIAHKRILSTPSFFAYLKIAEGCDNHCTYCTIPSLRGEYRSRELESLVEEATILSNQGVKELILVAQDVSLYGTDLYNENKLHILLKELSKIENIKWIRMLYCYPEHLTSETINEIKTNEKVCHYLDLPIQHCEDRILKLMGRKNTKNELITIINNLRKEIPDISLRTTLITGFPGETDEDFENMITFIEKIKFDKLGVFTYSQEDGTPAAKLPNQIDEETKIKRKDILLDTQKNISSSINNKKIGNTYTVIVEGKLPEEDIYCSRSYADSHEVDGLVFFESTKDIISGEFVNVKIESSSDYDLIGVVVNELS